MTRPEERSRGRHLTGAYTVAQDPKTRGWLVLRDAPNDKFAYFAMFETDEASWDGLRTVFQDAGRNLLVKPRAIQGPETVAPPTKTEEPPPEPAKKKKRKAAWGRRPGHLRVWVAVWARRRCQSPLAATGAVEYKRLPNRGHTVDPVV